MQNPQTFLQQLFKDWAWIGLVIVLLCLAVARHVARTGDDSFGPAHVWNWAAGVFLAVFLFVIWSHKEMRAKRGLSPVRWPWIRS